MVSVSSFIESSVGLSVAQWKALVAAFGSMRYAGVYICDHFTPPGDLRPDNLEAIVALSYLADHSSGDPLRPTRLAGVVPRPDHARPAGHGD